MSSVSLPTIPTPLVDSPNVGIAHYFTGALMAGADHPADGPPLLAVAGRPVASHWPVAWGCSRCRQLPESRRGGTVNLMRVLGSAGAGKGLCWQLAEGRACKEINKRMAGP